MVRYYVEGLNVDDRKYTTECRKKEEKQNKIELFQELGVAFSGTKAI